MLMVSSFGELVNCLFAHEHSKRLFVFPLGLHKLLSTILKSKSARRAFLFALPMTPSAELKIPVALKSARTCLGTRPI